MQGLQARWLWLGLAFLGHSPLSAWPLETQYDPASRGRPKQIFFPETGSLPRRLASDARSIALRYLSEQRSSLGLAPDAPLPRLVAERQSLSARHFRFQQYQDGRLIDKAQLLISVLPDGRIFQVFNTLVNVPSPRAAARLSREEAYDRAWEALGVSGSLYQTPRARLIYKVESESLHPVYQVELSTTAPFGVWSVAVDAVDGKIRSIVDARITHKQRRPDLAAPTASGPRSDRRAAFAAWKNQEVRTRSALRFEPQALSQGQAQVFDPDPRTSLNRRGLEDFSPAADFLAAYQNRILPEVTFDGSEYSLAGPWAKIVDFAPPVSAPTLSRDGSWNFQRGEQGFNDAMSYFHIDQSQRYLQSLGYTGERGIQQRPIEIDANGAGDEDFDNSYFDPTSNRLAFGHGCVDDNEDADVILHEYGHAIQLDINPAWADGDTGAIGEGFGDYWAASYSLSTVGGTLYYPEEVFSWDGHGSGTCWSGRVLNAFAARYDPSRNYEAHALIEGGFQAEELWSTPLFQALLSLRALGVPREEVDRIVVEAHFGLGPGVKMQELAQATVAVAQLLYPEGPHAAVFRQKFSQHGILSEPRPELALSWLSSSDSGGDGSWDPGEELSLSFRISNQGQLAARGLALGLRTSDPHVQLAGEAPSLSEILPGSSEEFSLTLRIAPEAPCGSVIRAALVLSSADQPEISSEIERRLGTAIGFRAEAQVNLPIPDATGTPLRSVLLIQSRGLVSEQLQVGISIRHSYRGDLKVTLSSPSGKRVVLHDHSGFSQDDIVGVYPLTLDSKESLKGLTGESFQGDWELTVEDDSPGDTGRLESWSLGDTNSYRCQ